MRRRRRIRKGRDSRIYQEVLLNSIRLIAVHDCYENGTAAMKERIIIFCVNYLLLEG